MMILVDTNVLARSLEQGHHHRDAALAAMAHLRKNQNAQLVIFPQILIEFYAIATRATNSLRFTPQQALAEIAAIEQRFSLLEEPPDFLVAWKQLVSKYRPTNRHVFDFRLAAMMLVHPVPQILTFNDQDFRVISEIQTVNPFDVLKIPRV